jgi:Domain of unknown function (DUF4956)
LEGQTMLTHLVTAMSDLVAIALIVGIYFHHHQRRDLLLAYIALNVGILAVTAALSSASVGAGLGLGLFGILSIIRLRSDNITQEEIAYYFVALALGLLAGIHPGPLYVTPVLCGLLVLVVFVADHPRLFPRARRALLTLDSAIPDEAQLRAHLENRLGVEVRHMIVQEINFVQDLTIVDVRYRAPVGGSLRAGAHVSTSQGDRLVAPPHPLVTSNGAPDQGISAVPRPNVVRAERTP